MMTASAASLAAAASPSFAAHSQRVFVASGTPNGILAYDWDPATGPTRCRGSCSQNPHRGLAHLFCRPRVSFCGVRIGQLQRQANRRSGQLQREERRADCAVCAELGKQRHLPCGTRPHGACAAFGGLRRRQRSRFLVTEGKLSPAVWTEHYTVHGPDKDRQEAAHAHFASFSPDNRFRVCQ